MDYQAK